MSGSGVHAAGAGIERDMAAQDNQGIAIVERVGAALSFQTLGVDLGQVFLGHLLHIGAGAPLG